MIRSLANRVWVRGVCIGPQDKNLQILERTQPKRKRVVDFVAFHIENFKSRGVDQRSWKLPYQLVMTEVKGDQICNTPKPKSKNFLWTGPLCGPFGLKTLGFLASPIKASLHPQPSITNLEAKPCREVPEIRNPSRRLLPSLSLRRLSSLSLSSPRLFSLSPRRASFSLSDDSLSPRREQPRVVVVTVWRRRSQISPLLHLRSIQIQAKVRCSTQICSMFFYIVEWVARIDQILFVVRLIDHIALELSY